MKNKKLFWYVLAIVSSLCIICLVAVFAIESDGTTETAKTQTLAVASPTPTFTPSLTIQSTLAPTSTPIPTDTPFVATNSGGGCICDRDEYNCSDADAVTCFNTCVAQGAGDIHKLDQNNNGVACESN